MRTYLVVIDESAAVRGAVRFAARRAAKTGGAVELLGLIPPQEFVPFGGVQAAIAEESRLRAEAMVRAAAGTLFEETGISPVITVIEGEPVEAVRRHLAARGTLAEGGPVAALVLGAAASGGPGALVEHFAGPDAGRLPCPLMIVPGGLSEDAVDALS